MKRIQSALWTFSYFAEFGKIAAAIQTAGGLDLTGPEWYNSSIPAHERKDHDAGSCFAVSAGLRSAD